MLRSGRKEINLKAIMGSKGCHIPAPAPVVLKDGKKKKASFERAAREVEKNQTSFQGRREPQRG